MPGLGVTPARRPRVPVVMPLLMFAVRVPKYLVAYGRRLHLLGVIIQTAGNCFWLGSNHFGWKGAVLTKRRKETKSRDASCGEWDVRFWKDMFRVLELEKQPG